MQKLLTEFMINGICLFIAMMISTRVIYGAVSLQTFLISLAWACVGAVLATYIFRKLGV
jgi:uncharacterized phage infection (PIP) family protein YhgE